MLVSNIDSQFIEDIRRDMLKFAQLQLRDAALAEDAVQEALTAALTSESSFSGRSALKTWVFSILRNKIVDLIRQQSRTTNLSALGDEEASQDETLESLFSADGHWSASARPQRWGNPEAALDDKNFWAVFEACLTHLPENTARIFMMRELLEFETSEICAELGITVSNCNVIMHRARHGLRRCLESSWFGTAEARC